MMAPKTAQWTVFSEERRARGARGAVAGLA